MAKSRNVTRLAGEVAADSSKELAALTRLALILALVAKHAHWNVRGPFFGPLHQLFDGVADAAYGWADRLAERTVVLGAAAMVPSVTAKVCGFAGAREHLTEVADALEALDKGLADVLLVPDDEDPVTDNLLQELAGEVEKLLWQVRAHLEDPRS